MVYLTQLMCNFRTNEKKTDETHLSYATSQTINIILYEENETPGMLKIRELIIYILHTKQ